MQAELEHAVRGRTPIRRSRRGLRVAGWSMVWTGVLLLGTVAWTLFGTAVIADAAQSDLEDRLVETWAQRPLPANAPAPAIADGPLPSNDSEEAQQAEPAVVEEAAVAPGEPVGRISIPTAGVDWVVVEGVDPEDLKQGPGHMPWTPLPGQPGNAVISGHRTTYGAPFLDLDLVEIGDEIMVETALGAHVYSVRESFVVEPTDVWVTDPRPGAWLTLTTCTPRYSAARRLIIAAELTSGPNHAAVQELYEPAEKYDLAS
ncbi:MAG: class E sortase [Acidimicrobiia bacterium]|nr:class E sortase [Acidimicrobiia bacterium]